MCAVAQVGDARLGDVRVIPCEGCEAALVGLPDYETIPSSARIAPEGEPGEPLTITGTVYDTAGEPAPGIIIYAYHTDSTGVYPPDERYTGWVRRHGELRGCCTYWISSIHFTDDPLVSSDREREPNPDARGGNGLVTPRLENGVWYVERDIRLGRSIAGYR